MASRPTKSVSVRRTARCDPQGLRHGGSHDEPTLPQEQQQRRRWADQQQWSLLFQTGKSLETSHSAEGALTGPNNLQDVASVGISSAAGGLSVTASPSDSSSSPSFAPASSFEAPQVGFVAVSTTSIITAVPPTAPRFGAFLWANVKAPNRTWRRVSASAVASSAAASSAGKEATRANNELSKAGAEHGGGNAAFTYCAIPRASPPFSTTQLRPFQPFGDSVAVSAPSDQDTSDTSAIYVASPPSPPLPLSMPLLRSVVPPSTCEAPAPAPVPRRLERRRSFPQPSARRSDIGEIGELGEFGEFGECLFEIGSRTSPTVPSSGRVISGPSEAAGGRSICGVRMLMMESRSGDGESAWAHEETEEEEVEEVEEREEGEEGEDGEAREAAVGGAVNAGSWCRRVLGERSGRWIARSPWRMQDRALVFFEHSPSASPLSPTATTSPPALPPPAAAGGGAALAAAADSPGADFPGGCSVSGPCRGGNSCNGEASGKGTCTGSGSGKVGVFSGARTSGSSTASAGGSSEGSGDIGDSRSSGRSGVNGSSRGSGGAVRRGRAAWWWAGSWTVALPLPLVNTVTTVSHAVAPRAEHVQAIASAPSVEADHGDGGNEGDAAGHAADDSGAADGADSADGTDGGDTDAFTLLLDDAVAAAGFQGDISGVTESGEGVEGEEEAIEWQWGVVRSGMEDEVDQGRNLLKTEEDTEGGEECGEESAEEDSAAEEVVPGEGREEEQQGINLTQDGHGAMEDHSSARQLAESITVGELLNSTDTSTDTSTENFTETSADTFPEGSELVSGEERARDAVGMIDEVGGARMEGTDGGTRYAGSAAAFTGVLRAVDLGRSSSGIYESTGSSGNGWDRSASGYGGGRGSSSSSSGAGGGGGAVWDAMLMEALSPLPRDTLLTRPFTMQRRLSGNSSCPPSSSSSPPLSLQPFLLSRSHPPALTPCLLSCMSQIQPHHCVFPYSLACSPPPAFSTLHKSHPPISCLSACLLVPEVDQEATDGRGSPTLSPFLSLSPDPFQVFSRSTYRTSPHTSFRTSTAHHTTRTNRTSRVSRSSHASRANNTSRTSRTSYGTVPFPAVFSPALSGRPDSSSDHGWSRPAASNELTRAASSGATGAHWVARWSGGESGRGGGGWGWGGSEGRGSGGEGMGEEGAEQLLYEELLLLDEGIAPR
ncbi:unnamed protein product [Closterium sp. NIES-53]